MNKHEQIEIIIDDMYPETHKDYISSYISDFKATEKAYEQLKLDVKRYISLKECPKGMSIDDWKAEREALEMYLFKKVAIVTNQIDINKLKKGDIVIVKNDDGNKFTCDITGISIKHNTITCDIGDYATVRRHINECEPYFSNGYNTTYLKEV